MVYKNNPYLKERVFLSIDLETIPSGTPPVVDRAAIAEMIRHPESYKKQETIDNWNLTKKPQLVDEAVASHLETFAKRGLSGSTGRIISIALVHDNGEQVFTGADEAEIIHLAFEYMSSLGEPVTYVGHFLVAFDLNFLRQRAIVHQRKPPLSLRKAWNAKPWDTEAVGDTATLWDRDKRIKLHDLCVLLGAPSPKEDGMDGSKVWPMWQAGRLQEIADYNLADARAALECYRRIMEVV
jgi:3'-5' exonuclease